MSVEYRRVATFDDGGSGVSSEDDSIDDAEAEAEALERAGEGDPADDGGQYGFALPPPEDEASNNTLIVRALVSVVAIAVLASLIIWAAHSNGSSLPTDWRDWSPLDRLLDLFTSHDLSIPPLPVQSLQQCRAALNTTRVVVVAVPADLAGFSLNALSYEAQAQHAAAGRGLCILVVESAESAPFTLSDKQRPLITFVSLDDLRWLPYASASTLPRHRLTEPAARNLAYLLAMHAGASTIIDAHSTHAPTPNPAPNPVPTLHYSAATYPALGATNYSFVQCRAAWQVVPSAASSWVLPYSFGFSSAVVGWVGVYGEAEQQWLLDGEYAMTAVSASLFSHAWLPPSVSYATAARLRALSALPLLTFLRVPSWDEWQRDLIGVMRSTIPVALDSEKEQYSDFNAVSPLAIQLPYIEPCMRRLTHPSESQAESTSASTNLNASMPFPFPFTAALLSALRDSGRGGRLDLQLTVRDEQQRTSSTKEAVKRSLQLAMLEQQVWATVSAEGAIGSAELSALTTFLADIDAIRASLADAPATAQDTPPTPATTTAVPSAEVSADPLSTNTVSSTETVPAVQIAFERPLAALLPHLPMPPTLSVSTPAVVIPRQQRVTVCILFNREPRYHSIYELLREHTALHRHLILSLPKPIRHLQPRLQALLAFYPQLTIQYCTNDDGGVQHHCMYQALLHCRHHHPQTAGLLWLGDDVFFNLTQLFLYTRRWNVDEFWTHSRSYLVDVNQSYTTYHGAFDQHWNWPVQSWDRLAVSHAQWPAEYRAALDGVYGKGQLASEALSDILYVPKADGQMERFMEVLAVQQTQVPIWCEVVTTVLVDIAMILSGRRPNLPLFPFIQQQMAEFGYSELDHIDRWRPGVQLHQTGMELANRYYLFLRRGAQRIVDAANQSRTDQWEAEMDSLRMENKTGATHYNDTDSPHINLAGCDADWAGDGNVPMSALRPVPIRPDGNMGLGQRTNSSFVLLCLYLPGGGWVHPVKMGDKWSEWSLLGMASLGRMVVQMSQVLSEDRWEGDEWCSAGQ